MPTLTLWANDDGAGVAGIRYSLDGGAYHDYTGPVSLPEGVHTVTYQALDVSGSANTESPKTLRVPTDVSSPVAVATSASPTTFTGGVGTTKLNWTVGDNLSGQIHVTVLVLTSTGDVARSLDGGCDVARTRSVRVFCTCIVRITAARSCFLIKSAARDAQ